MKLRRITITPAENGFTLEKNYEPGENERYQEPEMSVHESVDGVLAAAKECLTGSHKKPGKKIRRLGKAAVENAVVSRSRY